MKSWQPLGVEPRTPLACAASALPLNHDSQMTTNFHKSSMCTVQMVLIASVAHPATTVRTLLGADGKILFIKKEPILNSFLTVNAQSILPHTGNKFRCYEAEIKESAEYWGLKPEVSWVRLSVTDGFFPIPLFPPHNI